MPRVLETVVLAPVRGPLFPRDPHPARTVNSHVRPHLGVRSRRHLDQGAFLPEGHTSQEDVVASLAIRVPRDPSPSRGVRRHARLPVVFGGVSEIPFRRPCRAIEAAQENVALRRAPGRRIAESCPYQEERAVRSAGQVVERIRPRVGAEPDRIGPAAFGETPGEDIEIATAKLLLEPVHAPDPAVGVLSERHPKVIPRLRHRKRLRPVLSVLAASGPDPVAATEVVAIAACRAI